VAIFLYLGSGLAHVTPWVMGQSGEAVDAADHIWRIQDIREATVVTMLFTMFFTSMLATLRLATDDPHS
jgi:putative membrane protein